MRCQARQQAPRRTSRAPQARSHRRRRLLSVARRQGQDLPRRRAGVRIDGCRSQSSSPCIAHRGRPGYRNKLTWFPHPARRATAVNVNEGQGVMSIAKSQAAIVIGGGPAGLTTAISLAEGGVRTVLVRLHPARPDNRTTALLAGSITALEALGVWSLCADRAAPLSTMRIVDDTGRLWRAPEVKFTAHEIGREAFGYNIENRHLV